MVSSAHLIDVGTGGEKRDRSGDVAFANCVEESRETALCPYEPRVAGELLRARL